MTTLLAYSTALFIASWIGGWLPRRFALTHVQTQLVMSLVAGLMLGVAGLHLIPHSVELGQSIDHTMYFVVGGLVFMLLLLRLFHFHQHDIATDGEDCAHANEHDHAHAHDHAHPPRDVGWMGLFLGLSIHTILDGIALGAILRVEVGSLLLPGLGVFVAILLHKPLDALSIETMMRLDGWSENTEALLTRCLHCSARLRRSCSIWGSVDRLPVCSRRLSRFPQVLSSASRWRISCRKSSSTVTTALN